MGRYSKKYFINKCVGIFGDVFDFSDTVYVDRETLVEIKCKKCNKSFHKKPRLFYENKGCPFCVEESRIDKMTCTTKRFIEKAKAIHGDKFSYDKVKYVNCNTLVVIACNFCDVDFEQKPTNHLDGFNSCSKCRENRNRSTDSKRCAEFVRKATIIHGSDFSYDGIEYKNARTNVEIFCKQCSKSFMQRPDVHLNGRGCPICSQSLGERKVAEILTDNGFEFIRNKKFKDSSLSNKMSYDFYIPSVSLLIEFDGMQHFKPTIFGNMTLEQAKNKLKIQKENDKKKDKFAKSASIKLLRIAYNDNVYDILFKELLDG